MYKQIFARSIVEAAWLNQISRSGSVLTSDKQKSVVSIGIAAAIAWLMLSVTNWMNGEALLASIEATIAVLSVLLALALTKEIISIGLTTNILTASIFVVFSYVYLSGGVEGSGAYVALVFPLVALFFKGRKVGIIWVVLFFIVNGAALFFMSFLSQPLPYSDALLQRLPIAYFFVSFLIYAYESMHTKYQIQREFDQSKFKTLIENASDIVATIDSVGTIKFLSPSFERIMGYQLDEMIGQRVYKFIHPHDVVAAMSVVSEAVLLPGSIQHAECRFFRKDESWHYLDFFGKSIVDESGMISIVINARDLTERVQDEAKLRKSEEKYSGIFRLQEMPLLFTIRKEIFLMPIKLHWKSLVMI